MIEYSKVTSPKDVENVAKLADHIWKEYYTPIIGEEQVQYMLSKFQQEDAISKQIEKDQYDYYLFKYKGLEVGYMGIQRREKELFLSKLYISKYYRNKGVGRQAFSLAERLARQNECNKITLTVNRNNKSSIEVYLQKDFKIVKEEKMDIGNGFIMDDFIMEKNL